MAYPYDLYQPVPDELMQYFLGSGSGAGRFNQNYRPTVQQYMAGRSRPGPENLYQRQISPLAANLGTYTPTQMGDFTPSEGLMDTGMLPLWNQIAAAGARFKTPNELGFMPGGSRTPVVVEDRMPQDNPNYRAMAASEDAAAQAEPAQEAGAAPQRTLGLLGDMFGGASALDEYMTPEQKAQLQNQGLMAAAMQLLASSGPSRVPVGLGQALGEAYGAGQKGYTAAQQNLLTSMTMKQKMEDAKAAKNMQANVSNFLSQKAPEGVDANAFKAQQYMKLADVYAASNPEQSSKFFDMAQKLMPVSAKPEGKPEQKLVNGEVKMVQYYNDGTFKVVSGLGEVAKPEGLPRMEVRGGVPKMVQYYNDGTSKIIEGVSQYNAPSASITDLEILTGKPLAGTGAAGVAQVQDYRKSGAGGGTTVEVNTGEKGFTNEFKIKDAFSAEPIYKEYQGMKSAFSQIQESLKKANPIGDVAAATKIMKLLDPGSVVRESELGIAMAATGKMDRLTNYVDMWKSGTLLTPTQRNEFNALATELFAASSKAYNDKRNEYAGFGAKYGIDANQALGAVVPVPQPMTPAAVGGANAAQNAIDAELARRAQQQRGGGMR
jgi:hypothetical protein